MSWKWFLLLVLFIGPASFLLLFTLTETGVFRTSDESAMLGFLFSYWGFAAGLVQRSLYRMLLGLNLGAVTGLALAYFLKALNGANFIEVLIILALGYGFTLSYVCMDPQNDAFKTALRGFVVGVLVVAAIGLSILAVLITIGFEYRRDPIAGKMVMMAYLVVSPSIGGAVLVYFVAPSKTVRASLAEGA